MENLFGKEIRALSWKEPFATMMLHGKIETRTWATSYRGLVLICASKKGFTLSQTDILNPNNLRSFCSEKNMQDLVNTIRGNNLPHQLISAFKTGQFGTNGNAIAVGNLVDCRKMTAADEDKCFVRWAPNLYCHIYKNVMPITPFEFKGSQGWKKLGNDFLTEHYNLNLEI